MISVLGFLFLGFAGVLFASSRASDDSIAHAEQHSTNIADSNENESHGHGAGTNDGHAVSTDDGHGTGTNDGHGAHVEPIIPLPTTPDEIPTYIEVIRNMEETHVHDATSSKLNEHLELLDLVPRAGATHIAISSGDWDDPSIWHNGEVPGESARVLIPSGAKVEYNQVSDVRIFTVRVDGEIDFATDVDSKIVVDTMVISPSGTLTIGTEESPVETGVTIDIVIANNGPIDTDWDPSLLSRGVISHGKVEIHGAAKDSHEKVSEDPMAGDTFISFDEIPEGWQVGDTIVIAGTTYDGYRWNNDDRASTHNESEDEVRVITSIEGNTVHFEEALIHGHETPRDDLFTSVANYTRNVSISSEDGANSEIYERGHAMFMHSDNVDIRYMEFHELGRTDKSESAFDAADFSDISFDDNVQGRYGMHLHRLGTENPEDPAIVIGNSVYGSPGWGFVHHDSNAILDNNASYNTFGAGFVAESGNEIGVWNDNIAIYAQGVSWDSAKNAISGEQLSEFDTAKSGDGFWFQSRMVESTNNIAASVNHGFTYFHRGPVEEGGQLSFDSSSFLLPSVFSYSSDVAPDDAPILSFSGNETFAARSGLTVIKSNSLQGHDVRSTFEDFKAWSVINGAHFEYTSHYTITNFDVIGRDPEQYSQPGSGISFGTNTHDMIIVNSNVSGFEHGVDLHKNFTSTKFGDSDHHYFVVGTNISETDELYLNYDPRYDTILSDGEINEITPSLTLDSPLVYADYGNGEGYTPRILEINGTKTDSLGVTDFESDKENFDLDLHDVMNILETEGYYSASDGYNYFTLDVHFSDRLTGSVYKQTELVRLHPSVDLNADADPIFRGNLAIEDLQAMAAAPATQISTTSNISPATDSEDIWDILTSGFTPYDETKYEADPDTHTEEMLFDM